MQHSVTQIGKNHEDLSFRRLDKRLFKAIDFFNFAKENKKKYNIVENGDDLLVSTWHSNDLIKDFQDSIK